MKSPKFDAKNFLSHCSELPGVYQMYDEQNQHLYIGKAKNLKKRLASYFRADVSHPRTALLVSKIARIDLTVTHSETEALILERNLINANRPPYNVIFRDDKSYPYIHLSEHEFPRLSFYRGSRKAPGAYFGPFPNSQSVRDSLNLLQKVFRVRQCEDVFFKNRSRPCLQHQIGRCSGPCVGLTSAEQYADSVRQSKLMLEGKSADLDAELQTKMQSASDAMEYERAAQYRDQISQLRRVQEKQYTEGKSGNVDIIAAAVDAGQACVQVLYIRQGKILGSRSHYPKAGIETGASEIIEAFISQQYLGDSESGFSIPSEIISSVPLESASSFESAFKTFKNKGLSISHSVRGTRSKWVTIASETAQQNLTAKINSKQHIESRFDDLQSLLQCEEALQRIECFDISHSSGESTVASCVVFGREGARKSDYRSFNINDITAGDDYAAMHQALTRRYTRLKKGEGVLPDILLIDGGKGQMTMASQVLEELQIDEVMLIGIAKGTTRKAGFENLFSYDRQTDKHLPINARKHQSALQLLQQVRDEAHRFAITGHRAKRDKKRRTSPLEGIAGIGPKRRSQLLKHFGGWQEVDRASIEDLAKVPGISKRLAEDIYAALH